MTDYIYIILTQTGTRVSSIIKLFTKKPYNHSSLSGDEKLETMYSFCRTYRSFPLPATFNREKVGEGVFGMYSNIPCEVYRIPVTNQQKELFTQRIDTFNEKRKSYHFNLFGFSSILFQKPVTRKNKYTCSQFTATVLENTGIKLDKLPCLYSPDDLRYINGSELIFSGELNDYYRKVQNDMLIPEAAEQ